MSTVSSVDVDFELATYLAMLFILVKRDALIPALGRYRYVWDMMGVTYEFELAMR